MDKKTVVIVVALIAVFAGLVGISLVQGNTPPVEVGDIAKVLPAEEASGNFPEMVNGDPDAPVILVEYGNYQCTACAPMNPYIDEIVEEYDGKVAAVFRMMLLPQHPNEIAAASAALAAYNQGVWKEYKDLLFKNQSDWYYLEGDERQKQFEEYFMTVSEQKGDLEKFREDMKSDEVAKKISYDDKLSDQQGAEWSPYFVVNGEAISQNGITRDEFLKNLRAKIDEELEKVETEAKATE